MQKVYHFNCKKCKHEYLHNNEPVSKCPECGTENQNNGRIDN